MENVDKTQDDQTVQQTQKSGKEQTISVWRRGQAGYAAAVLGRQLGRE